MTKDVSVAILAAGLGTRMKSRTAKVLHCAGGLPLVEHVVRAALGVATPDRIKVVVGHQADRVQEAVAQRGVGFAVQEKQLGTGHALLMCKPDGAAASGQWIVLYGDCPLLSPETLKRLLVAHRSSNAAATVITTELANPAGYGRVLRGQDGMVTGVVEEKAATPEQKVLREINAGIYCFEAEPLWRLLPALQPNPASGEIYLTDIVELFVKNGFRVAPFPVADSQEVLGINTRVELAEADRILRGRKIRDLMLSGVTVELPETVLVDCDVTVGPDSVLGPFSQLRGATRLAEGCRVGACSIVENSVLESGAEVAPFTLVQNCYLEENSAVGPFARLRMESKIGRGAKVGNFVELKKTIFGAGSKAQHLAYLGDSVVGEKVNIGAGTITCNFDGVRKHATKIGDDAFVGSNSTLIAPVEIGSGSYVAAGSVITKPVPPGALGVARQRQSNKEGWVERRRRRLERQS